MSQLKTNAIRHTTATSDAITLASDGTATAKITNNLSNRNLIINGAMNVAQRGTSSTSTSSYSTVDRFAITLTGTDETPTQAQHALTSSDTGPWEKGFRYSYHLTNGNQTSGAGASDRIVIAQILEAQDIANSGWNYTSTSSYITLSFWVKSSVAQNFHGYIKTDDGTAQNYPFETGSLSADTWTKITKTIPGNSNLQFDNNNASGLRIHITPFLGTDYTASPTLNTWAAYASGTRTPDQTSTWYTTNDATFEITGVQLEVDSTGSGVATDFEHRSYGDELARCQRYYFKQQATGTVGMFGVCFMVSTTQAIGLTHFPVTMRTKPTALEQSGTAGDYQVMHTTTGTTCNSVPTVGWNEDWGASTKFWVASGLTAGQAGLLRSADADAFLAWSAEL